MAEEYITIPYEEYVHLRRVVSHLPELSLRLAALEQLVAVLEFRVSLTKSEKYVMSFN